MALFGRKKNEEFDARGDYSDEDEFDGEFGRGDKKFTKNFRDLKPQNKKKRKEPPKPWGKKERMVVLIVLVVTAIVSAILAFGAAGKNTLRLNLPEFDINSLNIFKEETIIVGRE
ncbi:MAG: hypothetical protein UV71_C0001G0152 [Microgenomates group bacterium GW2011_GWC1_43_13]|uniref:Uncharacterized protein n=3 Tax=Candidatus Woeseibacteriota TaxID=1752722 RepID=A0A837ICH6_9BACT|nr:MAG: hypothetical protein UV71_C0001G0152 [Microgenomates group bacterium GW2011_GWC1_43_13]KKT32324.1 MAG: hypothetical protein UW20_C0017G0003 [Candidatus Woesebacteria bacterium GW2011_GWB1_44_11]KKT54875.1 MAG: hypothetical protein UW47_C0002G0059 [Candidatus Woesebacteria bacterium GW2011_GWA1_44_23]OGM76084.1 MAG: hypothetical protein A2208_02675 [Candidatus Woesebacteria bacterium RIFOXYA1_FULL_43_16]OGM81992.1 MAG: hypothetical protein A2394_03250 [Candidatus Woesebacteria bacterium 